MQLPEFLEKQIEQKIEKKQLKVLKEKANRLSSRYMTEERKGQTFLSSEDEVLAYAMIRMPATYSAVATVLQQIKDKIEKVHSVLDIGAGTGAATWAICEKISVEEITCAEREKEMSKLGKEWMAQHEILKKANWISCDVVKEEMPEEADLVISSYMLNEIPQEKRMELMKKMVKVAKDILILIETGTPAGFATIRAMQEMAVEKGYTILAPCIGQYKCPLPKEDWCHTTVRVARSKWHKYLKEGEAPYEDEKFSYLVIAKKTKVNPKKEARILRHPMIEKGKVTMKLCYHGVVLEKRITKKEKEQFKEAKKKNCGDCIKIEG